MPKLTICALGSSFASGSGIKPIENSAAGRSAINYAHLLAEKLGASLIDLTCSSATLLNILDTPQRVSVFSTVPPQMDGVPNDADLVTVTGGGNDLGYSGGMIMASMLAGTIGYQQAGGHDEVASVDKLVSRFVDIIDRIKQKAPKATVYLVDYLPVFGEATQTGQGTPLSHAQLTHYRDLASTLSSAFRQAAEARPGTFLLAAGDWCQGHEVGSSEPWMEGFSLSMFTGQGGTPYHPNAAGHRGVAEELYRRLGEARLFQ